MSNRTVAFRDKQLDVAGTRLEAGRQGPRSHAAHRLSDHRPLLATTAGKVRLISVVPSIDTSVCDADAAHERGSGPTWASVVVVTVSADMPMAQKRWCGAAGVERVLMLSDYHSLAFGEAYGTAVPDLGVNQRAIFVVDAGRHRALCRICAGHRPAPELGGTGAGAVLKC